MKPNIIMEWRENGEVYQKAINRNNYLKWIWRLIRTEKENHVLYAVKAMASDADIIFVEAEEEKAVGEKRLHFKYEENREYNEKYEYQELYNFDIVYYFVEAYCKNQILFIVTENKDVKVTRKSKKEMMTIMQTIRDCYADNNEISTKLCNILPETYIIMVNKDRNVDIPEPMIVCETVKELIPVTIINHHKIIWAHINNWCE